MKIESVESKDFKDFKELTVDTIYASANVQYPALPKPSIKVDGVYYWSKEEVISFGKAVEQCNPSR